MTEWIAALPIWQIIRTLGIISYLLLAAGVCLGISSSFTVWNGKTKARLFKYHTFASNGGTLLGLVHGMLTVIDPYSAFAWSEVLIPFTAKQHPVLYGFGTLSTYGSLVVIFTSDIRNKLGKKVWRLLHMLSYPIFILAFAHGFFSGTDSGNPGIRWLYVVSILAVGGLTLLRIFAKTGSGRTGRTIQVADQ